VNPERRRRARETPRSDATYAINYTYGKTLVPGRSLVGVKSLGATFP